MARGLRVTPIDEVLDCGAIHIRPLPGSFRSLGETYRRLGFGYKNHR
jgi:hypothetical protein